MISSFIITFRETLEAALIVGIILAYLMKTKREDYNNIIYLAVASAIIASLLAAVLFNNFAGGFEGQAEQIFEGVTMLIAALLITIMIRWMLKQKHIALNLHQKVESSLSQGLKAELFLLVFFSVFREGIETVIFLGAASFSSQTNNLSGALLGIIAAIILGYIIFVAGRKVNIKSFFNVTSIFLILFAAALVSNSAHEFTEAFEDDMPHFLTNKLWDINPAQNTDGSFPIFHEEGTIGSIAKGLFGYKASPSLLETVSYIVYLIFGFTLYKKVSIQTKEKKA